MALHQVHASRQGTGGRAGAGCKEGQAAERGRRMRVRQLGWHAGPGGGGGGGGWGKGTGGDREPPQAKLPQFTSSSSPGTHVVLRQVLSGTEQEGAGGEELQGSCSSSPPPMHHGLLLAAGGWVGVQGWWVCFSVWKEEGKGLESGQRVAGTRCAGTHRTCRRCLPGSTSCGTGGTRGGEGWGCGCAACGCRAASWQRAARFGGPAVA